MAENLRSQKLTRSLSQYRIGREAAEKVDEVKESKIEMLMKQMMSQVREDLEARDEKARKDQESRDEKARDDRKRERKEDKEFMQSLVGTLQRQCQVLEEGHDKMMSRVGQLEKFPQEAANRVG